MEADLLRIFDYHVYRKTEEISSLCRSLKKEELVHEEKNMKK